MLYMSERVSTQATSLKAGDTVNIEVTDGIGQDFTVEAVTHLSRKQAESLGLSHFHRWVELTINGRTRTCCDADTFDVVQP